MSTKIVFFSQLPIGKKFRFQWPTEGKVYVKSSEEGAHHDGAFQPVREPLIIIFPQDGE